MVPDRGMRIGAVPGAENPATGGFLRRHTSKLADQIVPSVVATVMGAWIITNFVNTKPPESKPPAAQIVAPEQETPASMASPAPSAATPDRPVSAQPAPARPETSSPEKTKPPAPETVRVIPLQTTPHAAAVKPAEQTRRPQDLPKPATAKQEIAKKTAAAPTAARPTRSDADTKVSDRKASASSDVETLRSASPPHAAPKAAQPSEDALTMAREALERLKKEPTSQDADRSMVPSDQDPNRAVATESIAAAERAPTMPAASRDEDIVMPPLPPPVTVTEPSSRRAIQSGTAFPRALEPMDLSPPQQMVRTGRNSDAPVPPADIPNARPPATPPGFIIVR